MLVEGEGQTGCQQRGERQTCSTHSPNQLTGSVQLLLLETSFSRSSAGTGPILSPMTFRRNLHVPGWSSPQ